MPLETNQFTMALDTVYELNKRVDLDNFRAPSLFVRGGTVDVYTSEAATPPADKSEMHLEHTSVDGHNVFDTIPRYIYLEENVATVASIVVTGVEPGAV